MKLFTRGKIIFYVITALVVIGISAAIYKAKHTPPNILTDTVKQQTLKQTVLATGQVTSETDLNLSFKVSGIVDKVFTKVGQTVTAGQVVAQLDQKNERATITQAQGAVAQAQANYQKVLDGSSNEEIVVAQKAVDAAAVTLANAQQNLTVQTSQQKVLVDNAYAALLNSTITAVADPTNEGDAVVTVSGSYGGMEAGTYYIETYAYGNKGQRYNYHGLEEGFGDVQTTPYPMGVRGLSLSFSGQPKPYKDRWTVTIPNTQATNYVSNLNAYKAAQETQTKVLEDARAQVASAQVALDQAQASLDLKKAQARPAELAVAKAQIVSAQGQLQAAQASFENTLLRAPAHGTITAVDIKVGELAAASTEVMVLQDVGALHIEANISEANIALIQPQQTVDVTLDAFGPDKHYVAVVQTVDPASTVISGVVNYKVTASIQNDPSVKPGMTANMSILIAEKPDVLVVPVRAIIDSNGGKAVRVVTDAKLRTYEAVPVSTGLEGDGGLVEVTSGLEAGQEVVTFVGE